MRRPSPDGHTVRVSWRTARCPLIHSHGMVRLRRSEGKPRSNAARPTYRGPWRGP